MGPHGDPDRLFRGDHGGEGKKLRWAGRAWATGGLFQGDRSELLEDAAHWGIPPEALPEEEVTSGIWPENEPAVTAFLAVATQWRGVAQMDGGTHWLGLDQAAAKAGFDLAGITMTPDLWNEVRLVEAGAKVALNGQRDLTE
jgi:hypothetical protein